MHDPLILAYLAGVIDSDGYITIHRGVHSGRLYFGPVVGIAGTRSQPHDLAASLWGGKVNLYHPKNPLHRSQYQWSRSGRMAAKIIVELQPYLRVKADQAHLALALDFDLESGRGADPFPWFSPDYDPLPARDDMWVEMVGLNQARNRIRQSAASRLLDD